MPERKLTSRERIRKFRRKDPMMPASEMAKRLNLTKGRISQILKSEDMITAFPQHSKVYYCLVCNNVLEKKGRFCNSECRFKYYRIRVNCSYCTVPFYLRRGEIIQRHQRGYKNVYCSRECFYRSERND